LNTAVGHGRRLRSPLPIKLPSAATHDATGTPYRRKTGRITEKPTVIMPCLRGMYIHSATTAKTANMVRPGQS